MKATEILDNIKTFLSSQNKTKIIVFIGLLGMGLIMLSEFLPKSNSESEKQVAEKEISDNTDTYKRQIESELKEIIGKINGVGTLEVMVTIEGTTEYVYAEEVDTDNDKDGEKTNEKYQSRIVMNEKDGDKEALVKKIIKPQISGVIIVCQGGGDLSIKERVIKAVSTALNLPAGRICVEQRN